MTPIFRHSFAKTAAVRQIAPGEELTVTLPDSDGLGPNLEPLSEALFASPAGQGNPVYGPIAVVGAEPGDALRVHFLSIEPDRKIARTWLAPGHGFVPDALLNGPKPRHMYHWEVEAGVARLANALGSKPVAITARPFLGCIATASPGETPLSSLLANNHGGNIDHPDLAANTSLLLPVSCTGGLLYLGDMHAAQGQGEAAGGGLEISGTVSVRVELCKQRPLTTPRYATSEGIGCLAVEANIEIAARSALAAMAHWLEEEGWHLCDASMLVNQTCELRIGGIAAQYAAVSCFLARDKLKGNSLPCL